MHDEPVVPWSEFFSIPSLSGMILKIARPHGQRPQWGEIRSGRVLESGEVEISLSWTSSTSPYGRRVTKRTAIHPFVFQPLHGGPFYYPKGSKFRLYDSRSGLIHLILPPVGSPALVREADWEKD